MEKTESIQVFVRVRPSVVHKQQDPYEDEILQISDCKTSIILHSPTDMITNQPFVQFVSPQSSKKNKFTQQYQEYQHNAVPFKTPSKRHNMPMTPKRTYSHHRQNHSNPSYQDYDNSNSSIETGKIEGLNKPTLDPNFLVPKTPAKSLNKLVATDNIFRFHKVFSPEATQDNLFNNVIPYVQSSMNGFNSTIFMYGATGSGKTYTMIGPSLNHNDKNSGIIPRVLKMIFQIASQESNLRDTFLFMDIIEIYQQRIRDLQSNIPSDKQHLKLITDTNTHDVKIVGSDTLRVPIKSYSAAVHLIKRALKRRHLGSTDINKSSSRSHTIITLHIERVSKSNGERNQPTQKARMTLVDLAGSERTKKANSQGQTLVETKYINKSLSTLGLVLNSLAKQSEKKYSKSSLRIPYRNSLLTYYLSSSLGGNCKTLMIATVTSNLSDYGDSLVTLRYAERATLIQNKLKQNLSFANSHVKKSHSIVKTASIDNIEYKKTLSQLNEALQEVIKYQSLFEESQLDMIEQKLSFHYEMTNLQREIDHLVAHTKQQEILLNLASKDLWEQSQTIELYSQKLTEFAKRAVGVESLGNNDSELKKNSNSLKTLKGNIVKGVYKYNKYSQSNLQRDEPNSISNASNKPFTKTIRMKKTQIESTEPPHAAKTIRIKKKVHLKRNLLQNSENENNVIPNTQKPYTWTTGVDQENIEKSDVTNLPESFPSPIESFDPIKSQVFPSTPNNNLPKNIPKDPHQAEKVGLAAAAAAPSDDVVLPPTPTQGIKLQNSTKENQDDPLSLSLISTKKNIPSNLKQTPMKKQNVKDIHPSLQSFSKIPQQSLGFESSNNKENNFVEQAKKSMMIPFTPIPRPLDDFKMSTDYMGQNYDLSTPQKFLSSLAKLGMTHIPTKRVVRPRLAALENVPSATRKCNK